jgi:hypothetical protein
VTQTPLPWKYPYVPDPVTNGQVLRPVVSSQILGKSISSPVKALVDSGSEHVLAAAWLINDALVSLDNPTRTLDLGMGGETHHVKFQNVRLRLLQPDGTDDDYMEWEGEVGFVDHWLPPWPMLLGQKGFFDKFTVSMHRAAALTVVEDWNAFDSRFEIQYLK